MKQLTNVSLDEFLGDFKKDRRIVEYVRTLLQWAEIASKFDKLYVVQGGFAVELAAGKITRIHDDLDILALASEAGWFKERLPIDGCKLKNTEGKNPDQHFCAYKYNFMIEECLYIDIGSLHIDDAEVWDDDDGKKYVWPIKPEELLWERNIDDQRVKFLNPKVVYEFKRKQREIDTKRDKDEHDFGILEEFLK